VLVSLVVSTIAFFVASYFIKHHLDEMGIPKGLTRSIVIFVLALGVAYGIAFLLERVLA
jgi:hypothetical protein